MQTGQCCQRSRDGVKHVTEHPVTLSCYIVAATWTIPAFFTTIPDGDFPESRPEWPQRTRGISQYLVQFRRCAVRQLRSAHVPRLRWFPSCSVDMPSFCHVGVLYFDCTDVPSLCSVEVLSVSWSVVHLSAATALPQLGPAAAWQTWSPVEVPRIAGAPRKKNIYSN